MTLHPSGDAFERPAFGYEAFPTTRDQFKQFMDGESTRFADVIKKAGASLD